MRGCKRGRNDHRDTFSRHGLKALLEHLGGLKTAKEHGLLEELARVFLLRFGRPQVVPGVIVPEETDHVLAPHKLPVAIYEQVGHAIHAVIVELQDSAVPLVGQVLVAISHPISPAHAHHDGR